VPKKRYIVHLTTEELAELERLARRSNAPERMRECARILLLTHRGLSDAVIAAALGVCARRVARLRRRFVAGGLPQALGLRDAENDSHSRRVAALSVRLAGALGLPPGEMARVRRGALLHDIGKLGVPDAILLKPGPLTESEWVSVRQHPTFAYEMLAPIPHLRPVADMPYCHHERWDGTGYPRKLKGDEIPLSARIVAVADVWDALTSNRPYRRALPPDQVRAHLRAEAGSHFDPAVVDAFLALDVHEHV
jgi:HD-GYP domain-containing protein (c-di-GMP phosphodiesterase class II)